MAHLLALVLLIGLVDAANPSTIAPALYFATGRDAETSLAGFIAGVFLTNLAAGVVIAVGPGQALLAIAPHPGPEARHVIELAAGGALLVVAGVLWLVRTRLAGHVSTNTERIDRSSLLVGAGIMVIELPTALPYFAVIATVVDSGRGIPTQIVLLALFNVVFVLPLLAILGARAFAGARALRLLDRIRQTLEARLAVIIPGLVLLVAVALFAAGGYGVLRH